jgi:ADP-ribosyl-[dinitrogen reductase] hydrolase
LLAGEHPDAGELAATRDRIEILLAAGVRSFVDLTEADERESYQELLPAHVRYANFPMPDHSLPRSSQQMREIQQTVELGMRDGAVYVHCRAGIGRTGVAIGCYLREQGESAQGALSELNRLWQQNARAASWPSIPETEAQEQYVRAWQAQGTEAGPRQRHRGCLLGLAIGDALANAAQAAVAPAAWTDDTGMTVCVAESLLDCGGFDGRDQLERYRAWSKDPQGAGAAPGAALRPVVQGVLSRALWNRAAVVGSHDPAQLDPSPLARCAATALFAPGRPETAATLAADSTRVTHQAPVLVDACRLLAAMISQALAGCSRESILATAGQLGGMPMRDEVRLLAADWLDPPIGRRKPYRAALGVLDRAVRCFARSRSLAGGLQRALDSPGNDRDALCAVYGALAGAYYGESGIDAGLHNRVAGLPRLERLADRLHQHGSAAHGIVA